MSVVSDSEFGMDQDEMARRKRAFTTLSLSIFVSICLFFIDYVLAAPRVALPLIACLGLLLLLSKRAVHRSTDRFGRRKIILSAASVTKEDGAVASEIGFDEIRGMRVKTTVRGTIREISLKTSDGRRVILNGVREFDRLRGELADRLGHGATVSHLKEPIDFDHPWFYVVFGGLIGLVMNGLIRLAPLLSHETVRVVNLAIATLTLTTGVFWILKKPGAATYGPRALKVDRVFGTILIGMGLLLGAHALLFL